MRLEFFTPTAAPRALRQLFAASGQPEGSWAWFETLVLTTLANGEKAMIAALIDDHGNPVSAIPLASHDERVLRGLTAPYTTQFQPPLCLDEHAEILGQLLAAHVKGRLQLDCVCANDASTEAFLRGLTRAGLISARYTNFANWYENIVDFAAYWASRGTRLKSTIKRKMAALSRSHRVEFTQIDLRLDVKAGSDAYQAIYAKSWKAAEPYVDFIDTLLQKLGPLGMVRLGILTIDDEPAAAQIWLVQAPRATIFKLAYDPKFEKHSPGSLLTHWLLKELCEKEAIRQVDFGRGDDAYKRDWLHDRRIRQGAIAANFKTVSGLRSVLFEVLPTWLSAFRRDRLTTRKERAEGLKDVSHEEITS